LLVTQLIADIGDGVVTVALPLYVYERTGSATITSTVFVAEMVVGLVLAVIGGGLADRRNRRTVLLLSYAARAAIVVITAALSPLLAVMAFGVLARSIGLLDNPSFDAIIPNLADGDLQQVIGARRFTQSASILIGPAIGGVAVSLIGARATLGWASVGFAMAFLSLLTHRHVAGAVPNRTGGASAGPSERVFTVRHVLDGWHTIGAIPYARRLIVYWAITMASVAIVMVVGIVWYGETLGYGPNNPWYGFAVGAYGIGSLIGLVWAGGRTFRLPLPAILVRAIPIYTVFVVIAVVADQPWLMLLSWFGWGVALGPELVLGETAIVSRVADDARGRVSAMQLVFVQLGMAVGYAVGGPLVDLVGARVANYVVAGLTLALAGLWIGPWRAGRSLGAAAPGRPELIRCQTPDETPLHRADPSRDRSSRV
jgi:MFS family permease